MKALNLTAQNVLDKQFKVDFKGYCSADVDAFLDLILEDYQIQEENIAELQARIAEQEATIAELNEVNKKLQSKQRTIDFAHTTSYSSVDLLKRVSRLEEEVYRNR